MTVGKRAAKKEGSLDRSVGAPGYEKPTFSAAGKTLLEKLWEELDRCVDVIRAEGTPNRTELFESLCDGTDYESAERSAEMYADEYRTWGERRGQAQGVAYAIAVITSPYAPNLPAIKAQSMERANARWGE